MSGISKYEERIQALEEEVDRLEKVNEALMNRVERSTNEAGSAYSLFESNLLLQNKVKEHTGRLVEINRDLQREIRERKRTEEALRLERNFVNAVLDTAGALIVVLDLKGNIIRFNRTCELVSGCTFEEMHNKPFWNLLLPEESKRVREVFKELKTGAASNQAENHWVSKTGEKRLISWANTTLKGADGKPKYIVGIGIDITEMRKTEERLRLYHRIYMNASDSISIVDPEGNVLEMNPVQECHLGVSPEEAIGQPATRGLSKADAKAIQQSLTETGSFRGEISIKAQGGEIHHADLSIFPIHNEVGDLVCYVGMGRDITDRKKAEEERESLQRLSQRLTGPLTLEEIGRIVAAESRCLFDHEAFMLDVLDESKNELQGIYYEDTAPNATEPEEVPVTLGYGTSWKDVVLAGKPKLENRSEEPVDSGPESFGFTSRRSRSLMFVPIRWEENSIGMLSVQSYTPNKYSDRELRLLQTFADQCGGALVRVRAEEELKNTQAQLLQSEKMASLGMLVAGIAHEINTPIGSVSSMHNTLIRATEKLGEILEAECPKDSPNHKRVESLLKVIDDANKVIQNGSERITSIVRRLRSFARLDEAELKESDIHEGLEDTLTLIHHEIKHNIKVNRNYGDIPPIPCYAGRLNQVFVNILINAKQAIEGKGEITVTTYRRGKKVYIEFTDTGAGIPKENLEKIFDPGFTTKGVGVGTGLGLSICYQIMQDHHGEIRLRSEVGKGSTFTLVLPTNLNEILGLS